MKIGFLGLGKMGGRMVTKLLLDGHEVIVWNRTFRTTQEFKNEFEKSPQFNAEKHRLQISETIDELLNKLDNQKIIWLMVPAGSPTQSLIDEILPFLKPGDILIDGGNANFQDTQKRFEILEKKGIKFLGIGVSGGVNGLINGFSLMVGGNKDAYEKVTPILKSLSLPNASYDYFGVGGAGHFIKMVHNGVEYGMMQAIAEGFEVLEKSSYKFDLAKVSAVWQKGTIISSFLIDLLTGELKKDNSLSVFSGPVAQSGEALWTVNEAEKENVEIKVIKTSLDFRLKTEKDEKSQKSFKTRVLNVLRFAFGGHQIKK